LEDEDEDVRADTPTAQEGKEVGKGKLWGYVPHVVGGEEGAPTHLLEVVEEVPCRILTSADHEEEFPGGEGREGGGVVRGERIPGGSHQEVGVEGHTRKEGDMD